MTGDFADQAPGRDVVDQIEAALGSLTGADGPDQLAELQLPDVAVRLSDLHQLLQAALTSLDRA